MLNKIPPHLELDPKTGYTFSRFAKYPYNVPLPPKVRDNISKCLRCPTESGPFTRALERKSQIRKITTALAERVGSIASKAAKLPKELLKLIKL